MAAGPVCAGALGAPVTSAAEGRSFLWGPRSLRSSCWAWRAEAKPVAAWRPQLQALAAPWREVVKARAAQMAPEVSHKRLEVHRPCSCRLLLGREEMVSPGRADAEYGSSVTTPSHGNAVHRPGCHPAPYAGGHAATGPGGQGTPGSISPSSLCLTVERRQERDLLLECVFWSKSWIAPPRASNDAINTLEERLSKGFLSDCVVVQSLAG